MTTADYALFMSYCFGAYVMGWGTGYLWKFFHQLAEKI